MAEAVAEGKFQKERERERERFFMLESIYLQGIE